MYITFAYKLCIEVHVYTYIAYTCGTYKKSHYCTITCITYVGHRRKIFLTPRISQNYSLLHFCAQDKNKKENRRSNNLATSCLNFHVQLFHIWSMSASIFLAWQDSQLSITVKPLHTVSSQNVEITPYCFQDAGLHSNPMATGTSKRLTGTINLNHSLNGVTMSHAFFAKLASNPQPGPSQFPPQDETQS